MAGPRSLYGDGVHDDTRANIEQITICPNCKHSITLSHPPTTYDELIALSRENAQLSKFGGEYPSSFASKERTSLDNEIAKLEETLAILKRRQQEDILKDRLRLSLSAPVRRLPAEILVEIFTCSCLSELGPCEKKWNPFLPTELNMPTIEVQTLMFSHVCYYWRSATLSLPFLWSRIYLCLPVGRNPSAEKLLNLYLTRSQDVILDIYLDIPKYEGDIEDDICQSESGASRLLDMLEAPGCSSRCKTVTADVKIFKYFSLAYFHAMTDLVITNTYGEDVNWEIEDFEDCRSLRRVGLPPIALDLLVLAWDRITDLEMRKASFDDLMDLQETAPSLSSIVISGLSSFRSQPITEATLTSLKCLRLENVLFRLNGLQRLKDVLFHLVCPNLNSLTMHSSSSIKKWPLEASRIFFEHSPLLSTLQLNGLSVSRGFLAACLPHLRSITHLSILACVEMGRIDSISEELINLLIWRSSACTSNSENEPELPAPVDVLPSLQSLEIGGSSFHFDKAFVDFAASRRAHHGSVSKLLKVDMKFTVVNYDLSSEEQFRLRELCRGGLKVFDYGFMLDGDKRPFSGTGGWLHRVKYYRSPASIEDVE